MGHYVGEHEEKLKYFQYYSVHTFIPFESESQAERFALGQCVDNSGIPSRCDVNVVYHNSFAHVAGSHM